MKVNRLKVYYIYSFLLYRLLQWFKDLQYSWRTSASSGNKSRSGGSLLLTGTVYITCSQIRLWVPGKKVITNMLTYLEETESSRPVVVAPNLNVHLKTLFKFDIAYWRWFCLASVFFRALRDESREIVGYLYVLISWWVFTSKKIFSPWTYQYYYDCNSRCEFEKQETKKISCPGTTGAGASTHCHFRHFSCPAWAAQCTSQHFRST